MVLARRTSIQTPLGKRGAYIFLWSGQALKVVYVQVPDATGRLAAASLHVSGLTESLQATLLVGCPRSFARHLLLAAQVSRFIKIP